jgi:hypothetical protein
MADVAGFVVVALAIVAAIWHLDQGGPDGSA